MSEQTLVQEKSALELRFPEIVTPDTRKGYAGYIVQAENLIEFATALRDEMGYDFLSSVTGVDYLPEGKLEVVYHAYRSTGGPALVFKTQVPREEPVLPSLVPVYPGADFQEREAYDLLGIRFAGHPNLKRILMWEGFAGHPLRKDWKEAFFEEEGKPFKSRWPEGNVYRAEDKNPFYKNVDYPAGFNPEKWTPVGEAAVYAGVAKLEQPVSETALATDQLIVNLGPQHPSTHGVFRMVVRLEGETIIDLEPVMGYLHRSCEKIAEEKTYTQFIPVTDRMDYLASMTNNLAYCVAVEKLAGVEVPERAQYIRVIMSELQRIASHMMALGTYVSDCGAWQTPLMYNLVEREKVLDLFEMTCGARLTYN